MDTFMRGAKLPITEYKGTSEKKIETVITPGLPSCIKNRDALHKKSEQSPEKF